MTERELERAIGRVVLHRGHIIVAADARGRVCCVNRLFTALTGWDAAEVMGKPMEELLAEEAGGETRDRLMRAARAGREWRGELRARTRDGGTYSEIAIVTPVRGAHGTQMILKISEDITGRKLMEDQLRAARDQAETAVRARSDFMANMSHEIRTPIHAIIGNSELLLETALNEEQRDYAETARFSANVLLTLISDVLDFSKIESGKLELESIRFDVCQVVEESVGLVALEAHKKGLEIVTFYPDRLPHLVEGDPTRLRQVIVNLLNNAVKFTERGEVSVTVESASEEAGEVVLKFTVRDTGIGIPAERIPGLFQAFTQLDSSTTRKFGGTGLGLAISRRLVELLDGEIGVESREGEGSSFSFTARFRTQELADSYSAVRRDFFDGVPVLVVDDNPTARASLVAYLGSWGCRTKEAENGAEALAALREKSGGKEAFRVAFIDLRLPGIDGWQLAGEVNADPAINATRLVLLTPFGLGADEAKMKLLKWFDDYLAKPVKKSELLETLFRVSSTEMELEEADEPDEPEEVHGSAGPEYKILVAEDNEASRQLFEVVLRKLGHSLETAQDGKEAVEKALGTRFDLIFMDIHMPVMNGLEASKAIRAAGGSVPIIAVTASGAKEEETRCRESGMDDFLPKPFRTQDVVVLLTRWAGPHAAPAAEPAPPLREAVSPAFDYPAALHAFMGEAVILDRVIVKFVEKLKETLPRMEAAYGNRDLEALAFDAHGIKGGSLSLHARELGEAASGLESAARRRDVAACGPALAEMKAAGTRLEAYASSRGWL